VGSRLSGKKRVDLWYLFAEPDVKLEGDQDMLDEAEKFWDLVQKDLAKIVQTEVTETTALDDTYEKNVKTFDLSLMRLRA
jgi:hypothetical protein